MEPLPEDLVDVADAHVDWFRLLGDSTRLRLLLAIHYWGQESPTVTELANATGVRLATASAALRTMERTGAVTSERRGQEVRYRLVSDTIHRLLHGIGARHDHQ